MRVHAIVLLAVAVTARAAVVKRDVSVIPAEDVKYIDVPDKTQTQNKENAPEKDPLAQQTPAEQIGNDLRVVSEVHIPVAIVEDTSYGVKAAAENEVAPPKSEENIKDEEEEAQTPKPGFFQSGIQNLQALQQAAAISIQNVIRPPQNDDSSTNPGGNFIQQSIANLQNLVQNGIQSINQLATNSGNAGNPSVQSDEQPSNQNILASITQNIQDGLNNLNQTFQNYIHPTQGTKLVTVADSESVTQIEEGLKQLQQEFTVGLKSAAEGLDEITSIRADNNATSAPENTNFFQQFLTGLNNLWITQINNLNSSISNLNNNNNQSNNNTQSDEESTNRPNFFQQQFQQFQINIQNWLNPQQSSNTEGSSQQPIFQNPIPGWFQQFTQIIQNNGSGTGSGGSPSLSTSAIKIEVNEAVPMPEDNSARKKGHGGGGSGDNNDISGSSAGLKSEDAEEVENTQGKVEETPEKVTPETPVAVAEKTEDVVKTVETESA